MTLRKSLRRLGRQIKSTNRPAQRISRQQGVVDHIDAGAGTDGNDVVYVAIWGDIIPIPYHQGAYTPTVADAVLVLIVDGSPVILGKPIGFASF